MTCGFSAGVLNRSHGVTPKANNFAVRATGRISRFAAQPGGTAEYGGARGDGGAHGRTVPATLFAHAWRRLHFGGVPQRYGQPARRAVLVSGRLSLRPTRHKARTAGVQHCL